MQNNENIPRSELLYFKMNLIVLQTWLAVKFHLL
jgi:hypothetical protein